MAEDILATKSAVLRSRSTALFSRTNLSNGLVPPTPSSDAVDDDADAVADNAMDIVLKLKTMDLRVPQLMLFRNEWGSMTSLKGHARKRCLYKSAGYR